ncbi:FadR/GntR family transcriptional regulator [Consotaella salsifontis]|uniref:Transcriptional regulator, GntR family n=1 Tax=Consotaella salsifontis TaxID=1365950 RepID=A0A1T4RLZ5_9HYPH|nr:FadR/GntR family transcriptional regulator [Consotaella salsifontis]SKA17035.1 transcriptional regulator, GntR family [Consotaella salsifontis]
MQSKPEQGRSAKGDKRKERLSERVVALLRAQILSGDLLPGAQLPTEPQLIQSFGVSRTVIREAIAELRSTGMVKPIQGRGVFVREREEAGLLTLPHVDMLSLPVVLEMLEFRLSVEVEAAAIASVRRSAMQEHAIRLAHLKMASAVRNREPAVDFDVEFHAAIAKATNNRFYIEVCSKFGREYIPRSQFPGFRDEDNGSYLEVVVAEHEKIYRSIEDQDADRARSAMREHLMASHRRYRALAERVVLDS